MAMLFMTLLLAEGYSGTLSEEQMLTDFIVCTLEIDAVLL